MRETGLIAPIAPGTETAALALLVKRAFFMIDPDGNETEVNTRYLYGAPKR